jgi:peptidyl-dipeptidase Dcp
MTDPTNPLLALSPLRNHAPRFDLIREEHYKPAILAAIEEARENVSKIILSQDAPTFENTIEALETASETLGNVAGIFYNQLTAAGTDGLQALSEEIGPVQANFSSDVILNPDLFKRVKEVHDQMDTLPLTTEQKTLLDDTYKGFVRGGALLDDDKKAELRKINEDMSTLGPVFSNNVKKSSELFEMLLDDEADLAGLPESAIEGATHEAEERGHKGKWLFTLDFPSFGPFMSFSSRRDLREKVWKAFNARAYGDQYDNTETLLKIVQLRHRRAQLLGYKTHADFVLERRMAETPEKVMTFLSDLKTRYRAGALKDLEELKTLAKEDSIDDVLPWDVGYYSEKLQHRKFEFSSEDLRPYFPLDKVLDGTFAHFSKLFGLTFTKAPDYPVWHPDVAAYDVTDKDSGAFVGTLYADFYPRSGKKPGAWMTSYREQGLFHGKVERPVTAIVCNFTKPMKDKPSLLTHDEVLTLFHEMGHATHGLLAQGRYTSLSGTNVMWDFVELPSQLQENWLYELETLNSFAAHYQTGEKIPADLIEKLRAGKNFMSAWTGLRQMGYSILDMEWHTRNPDEIGSDLIAFEDNVMKDTMLFPRFGGPVSLSFNHIFAGGYSAGYYSYKWAEVLDADAFEAFLEHGLYNSEIAHRYRREILEKGGSEPPMILYKRFRGREPDPNALLRREGLTDKAA